MREACRQELVKLQAGDPENFAIWKECVDLSMQEFERTYKLLDIHYDIQRGESFYNDRLPGVVERLLKSGIAEISEGAVVVFFRDIPELADKPCIIRKSDGGFNYATTDIATVDYRINDLKADTVWYVVGAPQTLHFKQIFEIARREGYTADFRHITFGSILGEDRKLMKTRSGENVPLRDLLDEAVERARKNHRGKKSGSERGGKDRHREDHRHRRGQIRRSLAISDDRLHFFLGQNAVVAGKHGAVFAERLRPDSLDFPKAGEADVRRRSDDSPWLNARTRPRIRSRETALPVRRDRSTSAERFSAEHSGELFVRAGEQLSRLLRSLSGSEIGRTGAQFAAGPCDLTARVLQSGLSFSGSKCRRRCEHASIRSASSGAESKDLTVFLAHRSLTGE